MAEMTATLGWLITAVLACVAMALAERKRTVKPYEPDFREDLFDRCVTVARAHLRESFVFRELGVHYDDAVDEGPWCVVYENEEFWKPTEDAAAKAFEAKLIEFVKEKARS
jgi:hypothetical protein